MRQIKFRAWDKEKKRWFNPGSNNHVLVDDDIVVSVRYEATPDGIWNPCECRQLPWEETGNLEITQYTGLNANGKEIYDGDIVKITSTSINHNQKGATEIMNVFYFMGNVCLRFRNEETGITIYPLNVTHAIEIIGNVFENPELLKGGN